MTTTVVAVPLNADCRRKEYRREVFMNFYEFHLRYKAHPGGVYHYMPYLAERYGWGQYEKLWYAFINGNTQHPMTSLLLYNEWALHGPEGMIRFWEREYPRLQFDTDRRYHKKDFATAVRSLLALSKDDWVHYFTNAALGGWSAVWDACTNIHSFGRLSAFSFAEYLRIMDLDFDCEDLLVGDSGSASHRNGLCWVSGNEQWDSHKTNPQGAHTHYTEEEVAYLTGYADDLLTTARERVADWSDVDARDVSYFTLESTLCTYKGWHRVNRRYPSVYNDMAYDRIKLAEKHWPDRDFTVFWDARRAYLPPHLRLEDSPGDPGLTPTKQNYYRLTGRPIMMHKDFPQYANPFNDMVDLCAWGRFR